MFLDITRTLGVVFIFIFVGGEIFFDVRKSLRSLTLMLRRYVFTVFAMVEMF